MAHRIRLERALAAAGRFLVVLTTQALRHSSARFWLAEELTVRRPGEALDGFRLFSLSLFGV